MVTMDFVTTRPTTSGGKNDIWMIMDRLTKLSHFLAIKKTDTVDQLVQIYIRKIVRLPGVLVNIVYIKMQKFSSAFWKAFQKALGTTIHMITTYPTQIGS